jgi:hypothetical protein
MLFLSWAGTNQGCRDPTDYAPHHEDTRVPPPAPPELLAPPDSFVRMPSFGNMLLRFSWTALPDADLYEIRFKGDSFPEWIWREPENSFDLGITLPDMLDKYTWQVRGSSPLWNDWTAWSAERHFEIRNRPRPPTPISPPVGTVIYLDSMQVEARFQWSTAQDAQFYNLKVFLGTTLLYDLTIPATTRTLALADTGRHTWQVLAGSKHWEFSSWWSTPRFFDVKTR